MITREEDITVGQFYWCIYLGDECVGKSVDYYGATMFEITGHSHKVEFIYLRCVRPIAPE